ncbi:L,D-transpeptidase [bacterium]|nr:L,D-transpeptidase [bacterium]
MDVHRSAAQADRSSMSFDQAPAASAPPPVHWAPEGARPVSAPSDRTGVAAAAPRSRPEGLPDMTFDAPSASAEDSRWQASPTPATPTGAAARAVVDVSRQSMTVFKGPRVVARYQISTAARGIGNTEASFRTPLGRHRVHQKFGADAPLGTVFRSRVNTHTVASILTAPVDVEEDLILTRILWLDGLEPGLNKGPGIDSRERFIYIHGTNEEGLIGSPVSHGCVRMRNHDVIALFDLLPRGAEVEIVRGGG